jgi:hypothetical protein
VQHQLGAVVEPHVLEPHDRDLRRLEVLVLQHCERRRRLI